MPKKHKDIPGQLPLWEPEADWEPTDPKTAPLLKGEMLGFDIETRDPNLTTSGPGFLRGEAEVVGYSISDGRVSYYFPFAHEYGDNQDRDDCLTYLRQYTDDPECTLVGANTLYEREGLWSLGIDPVCRILDIQIAEPLIDESIKQGTNLGALGRKYLGEAKAEEDLNAAAKAFGVDPKGGLWRLSPKYVAKYAEWDAWAPVHIWKKQMEMIRKQGLEDILELELAVQPILWEMRKNGIPIDLTKAHEAKAKLRMQHAKIIADLGEEYGKGLPMLDIWSNDSLVIYATSHNLSYGRTSKGNPSFNKAFLESSSHPFYKNVRTARELDRLVSTFIDSWILDKHVDGVVHPQWKQLASDDGGTKTGRMAASNPNPQQVPTRSKNSKVIRTLFRHPKRKWAKIDYSQQEPRILLHYAYLLKLPGAAEAVQAYIDDPNTDFYKYMMELAAVERSVAKDLYLGRTYGMQAYSLSTRLGTTVEEAVDILSDFDKKMPFIKGINDYCEKKANQRGWIKTLGGRKRHFNEWEPASRKTAGERGLDTFPVASREKAMEKWPGLSITRADTRLALNSLIQGSAADMTKMAMVAVYSKMGLTAVMQVHDELNFLVDSIEQAQEIKHIMENCVDMVVPIKADLDYGDAWA